MLQRRRRSETADERLDRLIEQERMVREGSQGHGVGAELRRLQLEAPTVANDGMQQPNGDDQVMRPPQGAPEVFGPDARLAPLFDDLAVQEGNPGAQDRRDQPQEVRAELPQQPAHGHEQEPRAGLLELADGALPGPGGLGDGLPVRNDHGQGRLDLDGNLPAVVAGNSNDPGMNAPTGIQLVQSGVAAYTAAGLRTLLDQGGNLGRLITGDRLGDQLVLLGPNARNGGLLPQGQGHRQGQDLLPDGIQADVVQGRLMEALTPERTDAPPPQVNPFWSDEAQRGALLDAYAPNAGSMTRPAELPAQAEHRRQDGNGDMEALRLRLLQDAENQFQAEVNRRRGEEGNSYHTASSDSDPLGFGQQTPGLRALGDPGQPPGLTQGVLGLGGYQPQGPCPSGPLQPAAGILQPAGVPQLGGGALLHGAGVLSHGGPLPQGQGHQHGAQPGGLSGGGAQSVAGGLSNLMGVAGGIGSPPGIPSGHALGSPPYNAPLPEVPRSSDLPPLPTLGGEASALQFGDWLTLVAPAMHDLAPSAREWWILVMTEVDGLYQLWLQSSPLQRLRIRPEVRQYAIPHQRTEQKAVTLLLQLLPETIKRDVVASRMLTTVNIIFRLHTLFQPGGGGERTNLLQQITNPKTNGTVADVMASLRQWRRWVGRAEELAVSLPDVTVLMGVMAKFCDTLGRLGGGQMAFRVASARQELGVDYRPNYPAVKELAEFLQAEAEELHLVTGVKAASTSTTTTAAVKALATGDFEAKDAKEGKGSKPACKFWKSEDGCRKGASCTFGHDTSDMKGRCFTCGAQSHVKRECPTAKKEETPEKKVSKVKGGGKSKSEPAAKPEKTKVETVKEDDQKPPSEPRTSTTSTAEEPETEDQVQALLREATGVLKSLRTMKGGHVKTVRLKQVSQVMPGKESWALIDGGATHALRTAKPHEVADAEEVQVELASGSVWLLRHPSHKTLLSLEEIEPIIPVHMLISHGYKLDWQPHHCIFRHPSKEDLHCTLRGGCPVVDRDRALEILNGFEKEQRIGSPMDEKELEWWKRRFPEVPDAVWRHMEGQGEEVDGSRCPWNRRRRRALLSSKGVIIHLFAGDPSTWTKENWGDYEMLAVDTTMGSQFSLHNPHTWSFLWKLANMGLIRAIIGGPPCRTTSRLRHRAPPGPRPIRGRDGERFARSGATEAEQELAHSDTALFMKHIGLWLRASERNPLDIEVGMGLENPEDPANYLPKHEVLANGYPSFWNFEEVKSLIGLHGLRLIHFDQSRMGHPRRKPTSFLTNLPGMIDLDGMRGGGESGPQSDSLEERMEQSRSWAKWAPGLVRALKASLKIYLKSLPETSSPREHDDPEAPIMQKTKLNLEEWKAHVRAGHRPYRRDCRRCLEMMGVDGKHKRTTGEAASHCFSLDLVGPMPEGKDLGTDTRQKYFMVATVALPKIPREPQEAEGLDLHPGEDDHSGHREVPEGDSVPGELEGILPEMDLEGQDEAVEIAPEEAAQDLNEKWKQHIKDLAEPVGVRNITIAEPVESRNQHDVTRVAEKIYCRFRSMGIWARRVHTDRETAFLSRTFQAFCRRSGLYQTMTGGDEGPSNGRIETEVQQVKRRVRLLMRESGLEEKFWPGVVRHAGEERMRAQLKDFGVPSPPLLPIGSMVTVKTKRWHRAGFGPLVPPFRTMRLMGPSPLMSTGYVLEADGNVQHARLAVSTDATADRAVLELQALDRPGRPERRLHGKQPRDPMLPQLPRPLQRSDAELLQHLDGHAQEDQGAEHAIADAEPVAHAPLEELDPDDLYYPESPLPDDGEDGPALHELRAGGEWPMSSKMLVEANEDKDYVICGGCGLLQEGYEGRCGVCEAKLESLSSGLSLTVPLPGLAMCSLDFGTKLQDQMVEEHWRWKTMWSDALGQVAVGSEDGEAHGHLLQYLEEQVKMREEDLEDLHRGECLGRLSALSNPEDLKVDGSGGEATTSHVVLQTYTVPLAEVRRDLPLWKEALEKELNSLVDRTGTIRKVDVDRLSQEPGFDRMQTAPAKIVPTIKAPHGVRKTRIVVCGNLLEDAHKTPGTEPQKPKSELANPLYAGGLDGAALRCVLRLTASQGWSAATTDVRTAFLLAPRQEAQHSLLVVRPPALLREAGLATEKERWVIQKALYGLDSSPKNWADYRDSEFRKISWTSSSRTFWLTQCPERNLWRILSRADSQMHQLEIDEDEAKTEGYVVVYVDDLLIVGGSTTVQEGLNRIRSQWECSEPSWVNSDDWTRFCGLELRWQGDNLLLGQPAYAKELGQRHGELPPKLTPLPKIDGELEPEVDPSIDDVRRAQGLVGELLWLSVRSRPDLSYAISLMGRHVTRCPKKVLELGEHVLGYVQQTWDQALSYGPCSEDWGEPGGDGCDDLGRGTSLRDLQVFSDASHAPGGGRGHQGLIVTWAGAPVQWESRQQPFGTLSSTESELVGYVEGLTIGESVGSVIQSLCPMMDLRYGLIGDNLSGLQLLAAPDGPWRTRHLRLRSFVLKERLRNRDWDATHSPGSELMADFLTKSIVVSNRWDQFRKVLGFVKTEDHVEAKKINALAAAASALCQVASLKKLDEMVRVAATLGLSAITAVMECGMGLQKSDPLEGMAPKADPGGIPMNSTPAPRLCALRAVREGDREAPWDAPEFQTLPMGAKDRWMQLRGGWWVKSHAKLRIKTFHPLHSRTPFQLEEINAERYTVYFENTGRLWERHIRQDRWTEEAPTALLDARDGRWKGFTFFRMRGREHVEQREDSEPTSRGTEAMSTSSSAWMDSQATSRRSSMRSEMEVDPGYGDEAVEYPYEFPMGEERLPRRPERAERFDQLPKAAPRELIRRNQAQALADQRPEVPPDPRPEVPLTQAPLPRPTTSTSSTTRWGARGSTSLSRPTGSTLEGSSSSMSRPMASEATGSSSTPAGSAGRGYGGSDPRSSRALQRGSAAARPSGNGADVADAYVQAPAEEDQGEPQDGQLRELRNRVNAEIVNRILDPAPQNLRNNPFPHAHEVPPLNGVHHDTLRMRHPSVRGYYNWQEASDASDGSFEHVPEDEEGDFNEPGEAINRLL